MQSWKHNSIHLLSLLYKLNDDFNLRQVVMR